MHRRKFLEDSAGFSALFLIPGILKAGVLSELKTPKESSNYNTNTKTNKMQYINFGPAHLKVTNIEQSIKFWRDVAGMQVRKEGPVTEIGNFKRTLVVLHPEATVKKLRGYSGLYHVAIHLGTETELAELFLRLKDRGWRMSPTDHIIAKSIYVEDPDGITIEFAVETPNRVTKEIRTATDFKVLDDKGKIRSPIEPLDIQELLTHLKDNDPNRTFPDSAIVGHYNLYQPNLDEAYEFYKKLQFTEHIFFPAQVWGDLGCGGVVDHRIAVNMWAGVNAPKQPENMAGLKYMIMKYDTAERLNKALSSFKNVVKNKEGYFIEDPAGNKILMS